MHLKRILILFLTFAIVSNALKSGFCFAYYVLDNDSFVENFCKNKDKPELHCHGKCKLMEASKESSDKDSVFVEFMKMDTVWSLHCLFTYHPPMKDFYKKPIFGYTNLYRFIPIDTFFHPPYLLEICIF